MTDVFMQSQGFLGNRSGSRIFGTEYLPVYVDDPVAHAQGSRKHEDPECNQPAPLGAAGFPVHKTFPAIYQHLSRFTDSHVHVVDTPQDHGVAESVALRRPRLSQIV